MLYIGFDLPITEVIAVFVGKVQKPGYLLFLSRKSKMFSGAIFGIFLAIFDRLLL